MLAAIERNNAWTITHADGAPETGVASSRLRERAWFAAGSKAKVAYQDRWHDCKILSVSRDARTCTVRYDDRVDASRPFRLIRKRVPAPDVVLPVMSIRW